MDEYYPLDDLIALDEPDWPQMFNVLDTDNDGYISVLEFRALLVNESLRRRFKLRQHAVDEILERAGDDMFRRITYEEFISMVSCMSNDDQYETNHSDPYSFNTEIRLVRPSDYDSADYLSGYSESEASDIQFRFDQFLIELDSISAGENEFHYLGEGDDVHGRTVFMEEDCVTIPIVSLEPMVIPGHVIPLPAQSSLRATIDYVIKNGTNTFGVIIGRYGVTVEIFKKWDDSSLTRFVNVKGRQRFRLLSACSCANGIEMGRVLIRPDTHTVSFTTSCSSLLTCNKPLTCNTLHSCMHAHGLCWPTFIQRLFCTQSLAKHLLQAFSQHIPRVKPKLSDQCSDVELSFWMINNLPLSPQRRCELLDIDSVPLRLYKLLLFIEKLDTLHCSFCHGEVARARDMFCMPGASGPFTSHIDYAGTVHQVCTFLLVHRGNVDARGLHIPAYNWFAGYAPTETVCDCCGMVNGWQFEHVDLYTDGERRICESRLDVFYGFMWWAVYADSPEDM